MEFVRKNEDGKYYLSFLENTEYDKLKKDLKLDYFDTIKEDYRFENEKRISDLYLHRSDAIERSCQMYFEDESKCRDSTRIESHKKYATKDGLDNKRSLHICHNCKIIMWHTMSWCFKCGTQTPRRDITNRRLIELYDEGYKIGW